MPNEIDRHKLDDAVGRVLRYTGEVYEQFSRIYDPDEDFGWDRDSELDHREEYLDAALRALVNVVGGNRYLDFYEVDLAHFRAKRDYVNKMGKGEEPHGYEIWKQIGGTKSTLSTVEGLFREDDLFDEDVAKLLSVTLEEAADLKIALPYIKTRLV